MSLGLQGTRRRIASVNSTKKITKAMQLVATAKLKTMKKNLSATTLYANEIESLIASLLAKVPSDQFADLFELPKEHKDCKIHLIVTSSLGLCGGYNYNLYRYLSPFINKEKDLLIIIGSKGCSYFRNRGYRVDDRFESFSSHITYQSVEEIIKYLLFLYRKGECNGINIGYTQFKNQITFIPIFKELFPFSNLNEKVSNLSRKERDMIVEPNPLVVVKSLLPLYLKSVLFAYLNESFTSEYASRRNAMESATDNAEEIVSKLQIDYNKARQAAITQEITEVVGGANAQK